MIYIPPQFREDRLDRLADAIKDIQLASLVTSTESGYHASHIPLILKRSGDDTFLEGHVARSNSHWLAVKEETPSVAIFMGPQAYISPSWYASKIEHGKVVPTWNYLIVYAEGKLVAVQDKQWLLNHLHELVAINESERVHPWSIADAPPDFINGLSRSIVGMRIAVNKLQGCWKMIQHRSKDDRLGAISGLYSEGGPNNENVADIMRQIESERLNRLDP
jgi:transcriptional regulator